jgi:hypothetical protein
MAQFINGDPATGVLGTVVTAEFLNALGISPSLLTAVRTVTANDDVEVDTDYVLLCDCTAGDISLQLAALVDLQSSREYVFKKIDSSANKATIVCDGAETIDGATSIDLTVQWEVIRIKKISSTQFVRI